MKILRQVEIVVIFMPNFSLNLCYLLVSMKANHPSLPVSVGQFQCGLNQGWVSSGRNLVLPGQRKKHGFFRIFPLSSGRNGRMGSMIRIQKDYGL